MNRQQLLQALINTRLFDTWGDPVIHITDPYDRERLTLLLIRDGDVIADLLADAAAVSLEDCAFSDRLMNAVMTFVNDEPVNHVGHAAGVGAFIVDRLMTAISDHIDENAEDWLSIARGSEADDLVYEAMDENMRREQV